jgi:hypothetical protein
MSLKVAHVAQQNVENTVMCFHSSNGSVNTPQCTIIQIWDCVFLSCLIICIITHFLQQDSAKAHTANNSMPCLERFATRIVRRGLWPPHFLDLNLRDFYLLGMWTMCILVMVTMKIIWKERHSTYEVIWWCSHISVVREMQQCAVYWAMSQKHWNGNRTVSLCFLNCMSLSKI